MIPLVLAFALGQAEGTWLPLFEGKSLGEWSPARFPGQGEVKVDGGAIVLEPGSPMTGITRSAPFPHREYEIRFEAQRRRGNDFFASLTFPVGSAHCTWVTGGWGGDITGLSSIDGWDASDNETRAYFNFENNRWYRFRLQVTAERIRAWIGDEPVIDVKIAGRRISLRNAGMNPSVPLGFASYNTAGAIRGIEYRPAKKSR